MVNHNKSTSAFPPIRREKSTVIKQRNILNTDDSRYNDNFKFKFKFKFIF